MKNVYISTSVHVRRLSGQTKQEKFPNIQPTFFVRILEPIWASFFDVDILQRLSIKVKRTLRSVFSLCYTTYIFTRVYCDQRRSRTAAYYSSRFFSRVYVSLWMPYIFILFESVFFARLLVTLDAIYFHSIRVGFFRAFTCHSGCHMFSQFWRHLGLTGWHIWHRSHVIVFIGRELHGIYFVPRSVKLQIICVLYCRGVVILFSS